MIRNSASWQRKLNTYSLLLVRSDKTSSCLAKLMHSQISAKGRRAETHSFMTFSVSSTRRLCRNFLTLHIIYAQFRFKIHPFHTLSVFWSSYLSFLDHKVSFWHNGFPKKQGFFLQVGTSASVWPFAGRSEGVCLLECARAQQVPSPVSRLSRERSSTTGCWKKTLFT